MIKILDSSYTLIKSFRWNSLFFKYWKLLSLFFMVPFVIITIFIYAYYTRFAIADSRAQTETNFIKAESIFSNIFSEIDKNHAIFSLNPIVQSYLSLPESDIHTFANSDLTFNINKTLQNVMITTNYLDSIYVYSTIHNYVISQIQSCDLESFYDKAFFQHYKDTGKGSFIMTHYLPLKQKNIISVSCEITNIGNKVIGLVVFNIDVRKLIEWFDSNIERVYLYDTAGHIFFSNDENKIGEFMEVNIDRSNNMVAIQTDNSIIFSKFLESKSLILTIEDSRMQLDNSLLSRVLLLVILFIISIFAPLLVSFFLSVGFYKSIANILANFQEYDKNGNGTFDELSFINRNIIDMLNNKESIEKELVRNIVELKKSQAIALNTQLNSHFLFNTLNSIGILAVSDNKDSQLDVLIKNLSDILHFTLNTTTYIIDVYDEIEYTKRYISIEEIKFQDTFETNWAINCDITDVKTLKFMLQPIIENSFKHGFKYRSNKSKKIDIIFEICKKDMIITIKDDGYGMSADRLLEVRQDLTTVDLPSNKNIGLCNVNSRIRLAFGEGYGVTIDSRVNIGTSVVVRIPVIR